MKGNGKATPGVPVKNFGAKRVACPGSSVDQMKDLPVKKVSRPSPPPLDMEVDEEEAGEDTGEDEEVSLLLLSINFPIGWHLQYINYYISSPGWDWPVTKEKIVHAGPV